MRMLVGLDLPDSGHAHIGGRPYRALRTPCTRWVRCSMRARSIRTGAAATTSSGSRIRTACPPDESTNSSNWWGSPRRESAAPGGYSLGMRQRLGIATALLGDPPVLLLDEPVNGLDPEGIRWIRGLLRSLAAEGRTVLISSHLMSELEDSADHLVVVGRGRLVAETGVAELLAAASGNRVAVRTEARVQAIAVLTGEGAAVAATGRDTLTVTDLPAERVIALLTAHTIPFSEVSAHRATLEEAYMELTRDSTEFHTAGDSALAHHPGKTDMSTTATTASPHPQPTGYTSPLPRGRDGFRQLLHAEWTKLRTVRRWSLTLLGAVLATILASLLSAQGNQTSGGEDTIAVSADGTTVRDNFRFVHQSLTGDGSVTVRVAGIVPAPGRNADRPPVLSPWSKAGLIAKASTVPGTGYAAIMLTPGTASASSTTSPATPRAARPARPPRAGCA
ncbi:AAA family ATPase [Yinghuangia aomiensis]